MGKYLLKRMAYLVVVFFIISIILFGIFKLVPGDQARMMLDGSQMTMSPEAYEKAYQNMREQLGLDKNVVIQYFSWIGRILTGNFGYSTVYKMPVTQMAAAPLKNTVRLNLVSFVIVFLITVPLGIVSAVRKGKTFDTVTQVITILGYSLPGFIFAILFIYVLAIKANLLPISGVATPGFEGTPFQESLDRAKYMVLPVMVMVFSSLGSITRYVRTSMIDALRMDYIRTARAKGLREKVVIYSHAFRNSLIPLITIMISWIISIFSGSIVIESIFAWNGMGREMIQALLQLDFAVALAFNMFYMVLALVGNVLMDIGYMLADPRVKLT